MRNVYLCVQIAIRLFTRQILFIVYVMLSSFINGTETLGSTLTFTSQLLTINFIAVLVMIFIAYTIAIYTFRRGWNPDNFVIPIESSLADTVTTAAVLITLMLIIWKANMSLLIFFSLFVSTRNKSLEVSFSLSIPCSY